LTVSDGDLPAAFEVKECREQFKALLHDELNAQRDKIDQDLIAMGIDPHAETDKAPTREEHEQLERVMKDTS
jgi:hypothetical protein